MGSSLTDVVLVDVYSIAMVVSVGMYLRPIMMGEVVGALTLHLFLLLPPAAHPQNPIGNP